MWLSMRGRQIGTKDTESERERERDIEGEQEGMSRTVRVFHLCLTFPWCFISKVRGDPPSGS